MNLPSRKTIIPSVLSVLVCLLDIAPCTFHMASLTTPQQEIERFINESLLKNFNLTTTKHSSSLIFTTLSSLLIFSSIIGSCFSSQLSERFGRKKVLFLISPSLMMFGSAVVCLAWGLFNGVILLFLGRVTCGLSIGISCSTVPVYIAEISPASLRGILGSLITVGGGVGYMVGILASLPETLGSSHTLPYLHTVPVIIASLGPISYFWAVESPRYLSLIKQDDEKCHQALILLGVSGENVAELIEEYHKEQDKCESSKDVGIVAAFMDPFFRATILLSVFFSVSHGMSGFQGIGACFVQFVTEIGMVHYEAQHFGAITFGCFDLVAGFISMVPVYFIGRKTILWATCLMIFLTLTGMFIIILLLDIGIISNKELAAYVVTLLVLILFVPHGVGPCTISFIIPSEISPTEIRSLTCGLCNIFRSLSMAISQLYFFPTFLQFRAYSLLPFMITMISAVLIAAVCLPETRGLTVTEAVWKWRGKCEKLGVRKRKKSEFEDQNTVNSQIETAGSSLNVGLK